MNAFKDGLTELSADIMNALISTQPFKMLYTGSSVDSKTGSGTTENNVSVNNYAIRFTATGVTSVTRAELKIAADGLGQDMTIEIRGSDFDPSGTEGTLLKTIVIPKEFLPADAGTVYIPLSLTGLTSGNNYWLIVKKVGDSTDHFHLIGESSQDAAHPCYYRAGTSGAWTANNALHFTVYSGIFGDAIHCLYGTNGAATYLYNGQVISKVFRYLPPEDGASGGIRNILTLAFSGEYIDEGAAS